ncbi:MAG: hypothetical protein ABMB14_20335, partial [Myxococcota bacterium]
VACKVPEVPDDTGALTVQGIVVAVRDPDGTPNLDIDVFLGGGDRASPDSAGVVYYVEVPPGRTPVVIERPGHTVGYGAPTVVPQALSLSSVIVAPFDGVVQVLDPAAAVTIEGDGLRVEIPADALVVRQEPAVGPAELGWVSVDPADRGVIPGDLIGLTNDDDLAPIVIDRAFATRGIAGEDDLSFAEGTIAIATVDLPVDSILVDGSLPARVYQWSTSRAYWSDAGAAEIDPVERTATFSTYGLGWFAVGAVAPPRSCVRGTVLNDAGGGLDGAEVRLVQDGILGVDRTTTVSGAFCLPIDPGATAALHLVGADADRSTLYTWEGNVTGGSEVGDCASAACVDLGVLDVAPWEDADADRSWSGPGGDCDDADPDVNPNPTLGDGTFCGSPL